MDVMRILMANGSPRVKDFIKKTNNQLAADSVNPSVYTTIMKEENIATNKLKQNGDDPSARLRNYVNQATKSLVKASAGEIGANKSSAYKKQLLSRINTDLMEFLKNNPGVNIDPLFLLLMV